MRARALVVQPDPDDPPGRLAEWLPAAGLELDVVRPYAGEPVPVRVDGDALIVLGGESSAYDDEALPWLADIRALLGAAVEDGTPTLAICLGAQLLTQRAGGRVARDAVGGPEIGVCELQLRPAASDDPLLGGLPDTVPCLQWHSDAVADLPPGATLLAGSAAFPHQAFRLGQRAWAIQWHPEVTAATAASWAQADCGLRRAGLDPGSVTTDVASREGELTATWRPVVERFARVAAGYSRQPCATS